MYIPAVNREDDISELRRFVQAHPLCMLVTMTGRGLVASHIPVVLHETASGFGVLRGHLARSNSQWRDFNADLEALAIFTGPQHFISASWYPGKKTHGREVPTWNYVAVHAYGRLRVVEDHDWLLNHLRSLVDENERIAEFPWAISDAPPDYIAREMRAIVGVELDVSRVEGKWKTSQNRNDEDADAVIAGLRGLSTPSGDAMCELIRERRPRK
ncbi:MAG TPA: FMN-binding negative transcriptional regulator [Candidatus Angelobacter sp.]|nr:FMN-binding negative transcriptional regulator [Candidatus Angelobacter sp.]